MILRDYLQRAASAVLRIGRLRFFARAIARRLRVPWAVLERVPVEGDFVVTLAGQRITYISNLYDAVGRKLFWSRAGDYEPETFRPLTRLLRGGVFLDVGANTGLFCLYAAAVNRRVICHAFEPSPDVFGALVRNVNLNGMADRIVCRQLAVADTSGSVRMHVPDRNWSSTTLDEHGFRGSAGHLVEVTSTTLDDYVRAHDLQRVDVIKVDVEGYEHLVVKGARELLARDRPAVICECLSETNSTEIERQFTSARYVAFRLEPQAPVRCARVEPDPSGRPINYLFLPSETAAVHELQ